jgi:lipopolysaccharide exporter
VQEVEPPNEPARALPPSGAPAPAPNLVGRAVRGAFWMVLTGSGARFLGIVGTLAVTHYLSPEDYGEVSLAALVMFTASIAANCGLGQYIVSKPKADRGDVFHGVFAYFVLGALFIGMALVLQGPIGAFIAAPAMGRLLPGLAIAALIERIVTVWDRVQLRDMHFRRVGVVRSLGELVYTGVSVGLAAFAAGTPFGGGMALVYATLARSVFRVLALGASTPRASWWNPTRLTWERTREFFRFGLPMWIVTVAGFGASRFDNFVFSHDFGRANAGIYNLAYNFADLPAGLVSEQVGDVLVPSFAHMKSDDDRRRALLLSLRMLTLVCAPLCAGLAIVAPTLVKLTFTERYIGVYRILRILAMFGIARTVGWIANSYLQVRDQPRVIMVLETARMVGIVVVMHAFVILGGAVSGRRYAHLWACASVVVVFNLSALSYMWVIKRLDGISLADQILPLIPPLVACVPMMLAVVGERQLMRVLGVFPTPPDTHTVVERILMFGPRLVVEIVVGAIAFVPSALVLAPKTSREFLAVVKDALRRRRQRAAVEAPA